MRAKTRLYCFIILTILTLLFIGVAIFNRGHRQKYEGNYKLKENINNSNCLMEISENFTPTRSKTFLYLIAGVSCLPQHLYGERQIGCGSTCDCDILMFGYRRKCTQPSLRHVEYIHKTGTTYNEGKNYLYEQAMKRKEKYLYYIFMDHDITLQPNANTNDEVMQIGLWRSLERFLVTYRPAFGTATYCSFIDSRCRSSNVKSVFVIEDFYVDPSLNAIHYEALPYLLPFNLAKENVSWWYSQFYLTLLTRHYFQGYVLFYTELNIVNIDHSHKYPYEKVTEKKLTVLEGEVEEIVNRQNKTVPVWNGIKIREKGDDHCKC